MKVAVGTVLTASSDISLNVPSYRILPQGSKVTCVGYRSDGHLVFKCENNFSGVRGRGWVGLDENGKYLSAQTEQRDIFGVVKPIDFHKLRGSKLNQSVKDYL